jgi:translation elongation factor EF-G
MPRIGIATDETGDDTPEPEIVIRITVPEVFAGSAMSEVNARGGVITGMESVNHGVVILARVPGSSFESLSKEIASTQGRGTVKRDI